jgi:hypothetical protein
MPRKTLETQHSHRAAVAFWRERLGHKLLSDISKEDITVGIRMRGSGTACVL